MKKNYLMALASALLLWLAWPPIPFSGILLLVALVPLLMAIENIITGQGGKKGTKVFLTAGLAAFVWNTLSIYWVFNAINAVMPVYLAIFISLIPFGLAALLIALAFRAYYQLRKKYSINISLGALVCFWLSYEYLHQSWDLAFPWMNLGNGMASTTPLVQWYEYTGVYGGSLWIWVCNIFFFLLMINRKKHSQRKLVTNYGLLALLIFVPMVLSLIRYKGYEEHENPSNIVVVQPNIDPFEKYGKLSSQQQVEHLIQLSESIGQTNTEFFIWPETAIASSTNEQTIRSDPNYVRIGQFLSNYRNGGVLSGIESYVIYPGASTTSARNIEGTDQYFDVFNAAVFIDNSSKVQFYHKSKLVPGVEKLPFSGLGFLKPLFASFGGATGSYGQQEEPNVFYSSSGIGAAPIICYESIWGNYVAQYIKQGAQFIAVITNDGWWGNTAGKSQHLDYARLRAIETRRWVVRSANTGISAFIDQKGTVVQESEWWTATALKQDINLNEEITFYVEYGDIIAYIALFGSTIGALLLIWTLLPLGKQKLD